MKKMSIILLLLPVAVSAQQLKGTVTDKAGHPLDAVTVTISKDTRLAGSAFADSGRFTIQPLTSGHYTLTATLVGYKPVTRQLDLPKDTVKIIMQPDGKQLNEVTISAAKPVIERKIDRVTFNVESSIVASGGTAWDALGKAPGVQIKADNSLTANHKDVRVYMDGKPLNLSGDDLSAYLQGLPSDMVAQIEVFSNPPAKFEAQGGTVINIITKKPKKQGLNVTLNGGYTQNERGAATAGATFNYRKDKLNVYGGYSFSQRKFETDHDVYIDYGNSYWYSPNHNIYSSDSHNYRLGADYQLSNNQIIGFLVTGNNRSGNAVGFTPTRITNENRTMLDSTLQTNTHAITGGSRYTYNLNYNLKLDSGKSGLNVDFDYSPYESSNNNYVNNLTYLADGSLAPDPYHIYTPTTQNISIYSGKADYNYLVGKWNFTAGVKYSSISSKNIFDYYDVSGLAPVLEPQNGDHFNYNENTAAAYTSAGGSFGKLTVEAGLRAEYTMTKGYSITLDSVNRHNYFKLFPTLFLQYQLNDKNELQFTYGYRIERPEYARLNPAKHYSSPYNYYVGNPALQPAFVQNLELSYIYQKQYTITAYYMATHSMFSNVSEQDDITRQYFDTQQNLGLSMVTGLRFSTPFQPIIWWNMNLMGEGFYQREASAYLQSSYDYRMFSADATLNQSFTLDKKSGIKAELVSTYEAPGIQGIYRAGYNYRVDAGIKANILHGNGTLRLVGNDLFNSETYHIRVNYLDQHNGFYHSNGSRNAMLSLTYRLGNNVTAARSRSTASEDETKRAIQ